MCFTIKPEQSNVDFKVDHGFKPLNDQVTFSL